MVTPDLQEQHRLEELARRILDADRRAAASRSGGDLEEVIHACLRQAFDLGVTAGRRAT